MSMADSELERVVPELAARLVGQRPASAWQPSRDSVVLGFQDGTRLLLVPRGPDARLHTVLRRPTNPPRPFSFQGALRAHLTAPLDRLEKVPGERIVELGFGPMRLHLRLTGRSGGLWLIEATDRGERVVAAYDGPAPPALPALPEAPERTVAPRFVPGDDGSWDAAAARWFAARIRARREKELRLDVERRLQRALSRLARLLENLESDLEKAEQADDLRRAADTLAAHLHEVVQGADHVDLPSFDDPSVVVRVPLEPDRPPARSMERLYGRARRLDRMGERVLERLDEVSGEIARLRGVLDTLPEQPVDVLEGLRDAYAQDAPGRRVAPVLPGITTWLGPRGQRVLVGRDAKANRRLTFQVARGTDWWMHVRGRPGAHIVLPMNRGQTPPLDLLLAAGQIAVTHAGLGSGERAEVQYTRVRDVHSIPGSESAQVRLHGESVLQIVRDPGVLAGWERQDPGSP